MNGKCIFVIYRHPSVTMTTETFTNTYMTYISNNPYIYPTDAQGLQDGRPLRFNTGWHIIPNMLWKHYVTPKQWYEFSIKYEAYHVKGFTVTLFNMVPMTTQLAIQGTNTFTAFNNTIYALAYKDNLYETNWYNWPEYEDQADSTSNLMWKEGWGYKGYSTAHRRLEWPIYEYRTSANAVASKNTFGTNALEPGKTWTGLVWDPFNRPDHIMELRPGKNAITFTWECHPTDENKWFNIDEIASWYPHIPDMPYYTGQDIKTGPKVTDNDDPNPLSSATDATSDWNQPSVANLLGKPIVPMQWWWHEMRWGIVEPENVYKPALWPGTEYECYKYGPEQCFIKMIPLFNEEGTHLSATANICCKISLHLVCKPRRSAIYAPTWGPIPTVVYSGKTNDSPYWGSYIRYRTGGARRSWVTWNPQPDVAPIPSKPSRRVPYTTTQGTPGTYTTTYSKPTDKRP